MNWLIDAAFHHARVCFLALVMLVMMGLNAYQTLPREADPDIPMPFMQIVLPLPGVSPEDAERLLIRPTELELQSLEGLVQMDATAYQGAGNIVLEFETTVDMDVVSSDVREAVDRARAEFPTAALEPIVEEFNAQRQYPLVSIILSGDISERSLTRKAEALKDRILTVPGVLDADLIGSRDEVLEINIPAENFETYNLSLPQLANIIRANNALIAAGAMQFDDATYSVKVPGLLKSTRDAASIPIAASQNSTITLGDIAVLRRTFEDPEGYARFDGKPAIGINVYKRSGENLLKTTDLVKAATESEAINWPSTMEFAYIGDQSILVDDILSNLTASILLAVLLVMIIVVATLGLRSALMVGIAIPTTFLTGLTLLAMNGYTLNMMVMFAMVLSVGMLVDSAIVIVEYADRRMSEGASRYDAYKEAAKRMFWPIVASTATTLAAFVPFLFWNDLSGEFMRYLPLTLIFVLSSSVLVALIFLPLIGSFVRVPESLKRFGFRGRTDKVTEQIDSDLTDPRGLSGLTGHYARLICALVKRPFLVAGTILSLVVGSYFAFAAANPDFEFFIRNDDERVLVLIQGRGNMGEQEKIDLAMEVQEKLQDHPAIEYIYAQTGPVISRGRDQPPETVAQLTIDLVPYAEREHSTIVVEDFRTLTAGLPGVIIEVRQPPSGPERGKDVQVEFSGADFAKARAAADLTREFMTNDLTEINGRQVHTFMDIEDNSPLPGIEWEMVVDREKAGLYGLSVADVGAAMQLVTNGLLIDSYRPDDSPDEVDIRIRFPANERTLDALQSLRIQTARGSVPVSNFVTRVPRPQIDRVSRRDGYRVADVKANGNIQDPLYMVSQDVAIAAVQDFLESGVIEQEIGPGVNWRLRGNSQDRDEAANFFKGAMAASLFMIGVILLLQFNSFYHAVLTLTAVVFSVFGVLFGIAISGQYFSIIMTGTGIVALAGIVVNNNIVLIDTYHHLLRRGIDPIESAVRTAAQRVRPVLLTTGTTIMGLLPLVFEVNVNFSSGVVGIGSATSDWWVLLSSAVVYGLAFSTILTLVLTPVMLAAPATLNRRIRRWRGLPEIDPAKKWIDLGEDNLELEAPKDQDDDKSLPAAAE